MTWCFSTRSSVATVLRIHPRISSCLWVKTKPNMINNVYEWRIIKSNTAIRSHFPLPVSFKHGEKITCKKLKGVYGRTRLLFNLSSACCIHIYIYMIIAVRVNAPALEGARPSAGTVLTEKLNMFPSIFHWLSMIAYHIYGLDDVIHNI